ncbi:hypothetical protein SAMN02745866_00863 [Alteromonadaceae bacterium Bs31]|nr:hypothetical protein SAMN02745866_00863 [Alteromonadaceae bacterium Bs31]
MPINWSPGINDPTLVGWLTVALYCIAAWSSWRIYFQCERIFIIHIHQQKRFWLGVSCSMVLLALNKQLDLQTLLTKTGRLLAREQGWYRDRDSVQILFLIFLAASCVSLLAYLFYYFRRILITNFAALAGLTLLIFFIMARAVSFHYADTLFRSQLLGLKLYQFIEIAGIFCVWLNAYALMYLSKRIKTS